MKEILDYITNNVAVENGQNTPQFPTFVSVDGNVMNELHTYLPSDAININVLGSLYNELNKNTLFYGMYTENDVHYGYVYLVDENMEKVKIITTFTSGTRLFPIIAMKQDENNNMYALSYDFSDVPISRVLLFNNIFATKDNYYVKLRQSYIIPNVSSFNYNQYCDNRISKVNGEATYYIVGHVPGENTYIIEFKINVGSENEWNTYELDDTYDNVMFDVQFEKNGEYTTYYFYGVAYTTHDVFAQYSIRENELKLIKKINLTTNSLYTGSQIFCLNKDIVYLSSLDWQDNANNRSNKIIKITKDTVTQIYSTTLLDSSIQNGIFLKKSNNIIFVQHIYRNINETDYYSKLGILQDDTIYFTSPISSLNTGTARNVCNLSCVNVCYNLVMLYLPQTTKTALLKFEYNPNNYNGLEYSSYNSLVPTKTRLYSNGNLVFARNLYNLTINNSTTTATTQIPNTLLNGITISQEKLISKTNKDLITKTESITKNIYETLYINFIRSLAVKDEDTNTYYPDTATYINQNINTGTKQNCEMSFVGKARINYQDSTLMQTLEWTYNVDHYETSFVIDTHNEIPTSVDFMSNDETTIYITKDLTLDSNKYYKINQKLRIE